MSTNRNASNFVSTLCRCGRTSALDDTSQIARQRLECGHYICADCWHYPDPLPTPICSVCVIRLQAQEIPRLSFYVTAYNGMVERFKELEKIHSQKLHEFKQATDHIAMLKTKLASFQRSNVAASSSSPISPAQVLPNISSASSIPVVKSPVLDWQSESGKQVSAYIMKQRETLGIYQRECDSLKSRVKDLTTQLEAKNRLDTETVTAIEKAELIEAELEGLQEQLSKCEEELEKARTELQAANERNQRLTKDTVALKEAIAQQRGALTKAQFGLMTLQNRCNTAERDLASARESLKAKDEAIKANARSPRSPSTDLPGPSKSAGGRSLVYVPTVAELEKSAALLTSLQNDVLRLNREKSTIEQEIAKLKESLKSKEEENQTLGGQSRIAQLESQLAEIAHVRDKAIAQSEIWQQNRNSWKRWGELMALRAKQWEEEVSKAKTPHSKDVLSITPEEPPLMSPELLPESGKSRKRPLDMPDTDVDEVHAAAKPHAGDGSLTVDSGGEGTERKRARLTTS
ncbi:hypothetical protein FRC11_003166 [Ceratobasidium sp. 423]|nr:hypothetical protein FRC11_003166 [Ceratobasidium sp. 423]